MGVAATSMAIFDKEGMLMPYAPAGTEPAFAAQYRDPKNPPAWVGMDVWGATICFNTAEAAKRNIPKPETWKDLTKPVYKGQIVMPHPASSGTGFFDVTAWLQLWGEKDGWEYMDGLHENIAQYMHSGSQPCAAAAAGEYVVGISFEYRANREKARGAPIDLVFPKEGLGWDLEASGIVKGTKNMDAAKKLLDWSRHGRRDGAVREQLRDCRRAGAVEAAAERPGRLREPAGQERLRLGCRQPRQDPGRMEQALRVEGRAKVGHSGRRCRPDEVPGRAQAALDPALLLPSSDGSETHVR